MQTQETVCLAASYHFPLTYSCRIPMSSSNSGQATPAPGPATVRLAMVRTGIELFGIDYVRDDFFPIIRSAEILVSPPRKVAISTQLIKQYKEMPGKQEITNDHLVESIAYREICQAEGLMTVYLKVPVGYEEVCRETLRAIGYWGQASSLTYCMEITCREPRNGNYAIPLVSFITSQPIRNFFSCLTSEFRDSKVTWNEIMPFLPSSKTRPLRIEVYVWPMIISEWRNGNKLLVHHSLQD